MKRNLIILTLALLIVSLIVVATSYGVGKYAATKATTIEELHEACGKDPQMQKLMEKRHGKNWKKHHDEMGEHMKDHMGGGSMMGGKGMMM